MPAVADASTSASSASMRDEHTLTRKPVRLVRPPVKLAEGPFNQDVATRSLIDSLKRGKKQRPSDEDIRIVEADIGPQFRFYETTNKPDDQIDELDAHDKATAS